MKTPARIDRFWSLFGPLSRGSAAAISGFARRRLLAEGAEEREVTLGHVRVNYYIQGPAGADGQHQGPPLLLVHGLGDKALTWALVMPKLAQRHTVYAVDLPGYGFSSLPAGQTHLTLDATTALLEQFLQQVIGRPALVVGNSMGGWLAVQLAWLVPELVRGAVLLNPGGAPLEGELSWTPFRDMVAVPDLTTARAIMRQMFGRVPLPLLYFSQSALQYQFQRQVVREFVTAVQENEFLQADHLRELPVPAMLIWGLADRFLPEGSLDFFRDNMPNAEQIFIEGCGHIPQTERPSMVVAAVERFAGQLAT